MRYRIDDSTAVLEVAGELDHHTLRDISLSVTHIIETYLPKTLILDMSGVRFMDSSGLALVIGGSRKMAEVAGRLIVRNVPPQPMKVFTAAGISRYVTLENSRESSVNV
ncbi:MAG: STAS domain-containing protein [Ruminococcaceae bacterium]|nr:STAS domain-containing protein [Oscillospiraceae bacterium]